ncbi:hypothetical protein HI914_05420 [Erysiphe necator]|nr:hypothetical protein HI914_05420 [Erysiphe necator]
MVYSAKSIHAIAQIPLIKLHEYARLDHYDEISILYSSSSCAMKGRRTCIKTRTIGLYLISRKTLAASSAQTQMHGGRSLQEQISTSKMCLCMNCCLAHGTARLSARAPELAAADVETRPNEERDV